MSGRRAKAIRKQVYGDLVSGPKGRRYLVLTSPRRMVIADPQRRAYQAEKKRLR